MSKARGPSLKFWKKRVSHTDHFVDIGGVSFELEDLIDTIDQGLHGLESVEITNVRMVKVLKAVGVLKFEGARRALTGTHWHEKPAERLLKRLKKESTLWR